MFTTDAKGTFELLNVTRCYLDETITPLTRIHKAWYAIFSRDIGVSGW